MTEWLFNNTLATKGLLIQSTQRMRQRILSSDNLTLKTKFKNWQTQRERLAQVYNLPKSEREKKGITLDSLEHIVNQLEKELTQLSEDFAQTNDKTKYTWKDIHQKLEDNEAAIEIIRTRYHNQTLTEFSHLYCPNY